MLLRPRLCRRPPGLPSPCPDAPGLLGPSPCPNTDPSTEPNPLFLDGEEEEASTGVKLLLGWGLVMGVGPVDGMGLTTVKVIASLAPVPGLEPVPGVVLEGFVLRG